MYELLKHQWKEKIRSPFWQKSIILNIILGILALYLMLNVIAASLFADKIMIEIYGECDVVKIATGFLFYYFSFDLIVRFLFQQLPTIAIKPYLSLPIKKSRLLHYPLLKSIPGFFNIIAILLFVPFFIKNIALKQTFQFSLAWILTAFSLATVNNFLNFTLKKYFSKKPLPTLFVLLLLGLAIYLDISKIFSLSQEFSKGFYYILNNLYLVVVPLLLAALSYYSAYFFLKENSYIEDSVNRTRTNSAGFSFLDQFGEIGHLMGIELKLIFRNKRPKTSLYLGVFFLLYGFTFYTNEHMNSYLTYSFAGLLLPAMFAINYGQFFFSWESSYFDAVLVNRISPSNYIKSKYYLFLSASLLGYLLMLPYAFMDIKIALVNTAFLAFNIGINSIILLYFGTFNSKYIDLGKSQFMNYQGTGATQYLAMLPIMGLPFLVYLICKLFGGPDYYYYIVAVLGLLGIALNKYILQFIVSQFAKRKYKMAFGFRQK